MAEVGDAQRLADIATCIDWSPDGERLVTGSRRGVLRTWDAVSGELMFEMAAHARDVWVVSFSPDGTRLASAGRNGQLHIRDTVPRHERERAVFEAQRAREQVAPWVRALLAENPDASMVRDRIAAEAADDPRRRRAALRVLLGLARR